MSVRDRIARGAVGAALLLPIQAMATASAGAPPPREGLDWPGVRLGMTLDAWKALPFPDKTTTGVEPTCTGSATKGLAASSAMVVCAYQDHLGRFTLPQTVNLGPKWQAAGLRFTFVDRHLSRIDYQASVDAFDDLSGRLTARYGAPASLTRDRIKTEAGDFPRVRMSWNTPEGVIQLTDPTPPFNVLSVSLAIKQEPARRGS